MEHLERTNASNLQQRRLVLCLLEWRGCGIFVENKEYAKAK